MLGVLRTWWWVPLLILALLVAESALLASWTSGIAREEAAVAAELPLERVEADGLDITLTGFSDQDQRDAAVAAVAALESSRAVTGLLVGEIAPESSGDGTGADGIEVAGSDRPDPGEAGSDREVEPVAAPAEVSLDFDPQGTMTMSGTVGDTATEVALVDLAIFHFGSSRVSAQLSTSPGTVSNEGARLVVSGEADTEAQFQDWQGASSAMADELGFELDYQVTLIPVVDALNALFELAPIEFDERRARLRPGSRETLDRAVEILERRPDAGRLRVVGHTDSDGSARRNLDLSQRRAEAVVAYLIEQGIDPERVEAVGVGEEQLLVSPERSSADKQRNRRIEWELIL